MIHSTIIPIPLKYSNAYLVKGDRPILVDTGSPGEESTILRVLERHSIQPADLSLILLTHGHSDHCGSIYELSKVTDAPIAIHKADAMMLKRGLNAALIPTSLTARMIRPFVDKPFRGIEADIQVENEINLDKYGVHGKIVFTPGHTSGSLSLLLKDEVIAGDIMRGGYMGGVLLRHHPQYHYFADDLNEVRASIKKLLTFPIVKIHVGHGGPLVAKDIVQRFSNDIQF